MKRRNFLGVLVGSALLVACNQLQARSKKADKFTELVASMEGAMPQFNASYLPQTPAPKNGEELWFNWMYEALQDKFIAYVEWKEWDSFIEESVDTLIPLTQEHLKIDIDKLDVWGRAFYEAVEKDESVKTSQKKSAQEVWDESKASFPAEYRNSPEFEAMMKSGVVQNKNLNDVMLLGINAQLKSHGLRLIDVGMNENPYLICVSMDDVALNRLIAAFEAYELNVYVAERSNAFAESNK